MTLTLSAGLPFLALSTTSVIAQKIIESTPNTSAAPRPSAAP